MVEDPAEAPVHGGKDKIGQEHYPGGDGPVIPGRQVDQEYMPPTKPNSASLVNALLLRVSGVLPAGLPAVALAATLPVALLCWTASRLFRGVELPDGDDPGLGLLPNPSRSGLRSEPRP